MTETDLADEWRVELQPALSQLAAFLGDRPRSGRPVDVPIGDHQFEVTPAECELILKAVEGAVPLSYHLHLFCDSIGLRAKLLSDEAEYTHAEGEAHAAAAALVRHDVALGHRLLHAIQDEMVTLMAAGRAEEARRLADHRGRVSEALQRTLHAVGDEAKQPSGPHPSAHAAGAEGHHAHHGPPSHKPASVKAADPRRLAITRVAAVVLLVVLVVLLVWMYANRDRELPVLSAADFAAIPGVQMVVCRAPELIVVVSDEAWAGLDAEGKRKAAEAAGQAVEHLGYRRVELRTRSRPGLAEWKRGGEIKVND